MKILIIHNSYLHRGGEDSVVESEREMLFRFGHQVVLYKRSNAEIKKYSLFRRIMFILKDLYWSDRSYNEIDELIKREKPDIAHVHNTFLVVSPSIYKACHDNNVPVVQTLHNFRFLCPMGTFTRNGKFCEDCLKKGRRAAVYNKCWRNSHIQSFLLVLTIVKIYKMQVLSKFITKYVALCEFARDKFVVNGFEKHKFMVKPNFIEFDPGVVEKRHDYALFVGGLHSWKGIEVLLQAWKKLDKRHKLKIIGEGPLDYQVRSAIKVANIDYLGQKTLMETIDQIKRAYCVIVPSECYETCPRVIIEAYACGVPVIASDTGPIKELVQHGETGLLFKFGDAKDLLEKINNLLNNKEQADRMGRNARAVYEQKYTLRENYMKLLSIYQEAIKTSYNKEKELALR